MKNLINKKRIIVILIVVLCLALSIGIINTLLDDSSKDANKTDGPFVSEIEREDDNEGQSNTEENKHEAEKTDNINGGGSWEPQEEKQEQNRDVDKNVSESENIQNEETVQDKDGIKQEEILSDEREWSDIR